MANAPALPAVTVPSLEVKIPVKVFVPLRISLPVPSLVTAPVPLVRFAEMVRAFAGVVPPVVMTSSWLAVEVVMPKAPEIVEAPVELSCRMPPSVVALSDVIVKVPPRVRLFPPTIRTVFANAAPPSTIDPPVTTVLFAAAPGEARAVTAPSAVILVFATGVVTKSMLPVVFVK